MNDERFNKIMFVSEIFSIVLGNLWIMIMFLLPVRYKFLFPIVFLIGVVPYITYRKIVPLIIYQITGYKK